MTIEVSTSIPADPGPRPARSAAVWQRVSRRNPCPVCHKPDWCLIARDGTAAICARIESDRPVGTKGAGWLHRLTDTDRRVAPAAPPRPESPQNRKAPPAVLDATYRALLSQLVLSRAHHDGLRRRGLTEAEIETLPYRTLPPIGRYEVVADLEHKGARLDGVPGFYLASGQWQLAGPAGMTIPVQDMAGRIVGLQVRCDDATRGRYRWVSSRGFPRGCSPGTPIHVTGPIDPGRDLWITEGPLKADIAALRQDWTVLAVAGVGNWPGIIPIVGQLQPARVIVAFDQDKTTNPTVRLHLDALSACLIRSGLRVYEADWDSHFKGLDDLLTGDKRCRR